jgi:hypothetical protein
MSNFYQPLFDLLHREHGILPLESEMQEIISVVKSMHAYDTCSVIIRRHAWPEYFAGWNEHDNPRFTSDRLHATAIPLIDLPSLLAKLSTHNPNVWAVVQTRTIFPLITAH